MKCGKRGSSSGDQRAKDKENILSAGFQSVLFFGSLGAYIPIGIVEGQKIHYKPSGWDTRSFIKERSEQRFSCGFFNSPVKTDIPSDESEIKKSSGGKRILYSSLSRFNMTTLEYGYRPAQVISNLI